MSTQDNVAGVLCCVSFAATFGGLIWFKMIEPTRPHHPEPPNSPSTETRPAPPVIAPKPSIAAERPSPHVLRVALDTDGQFRVPCRIDAAKAIGLVDTGAGGGRALLVIDRSTADAAGIDVNSLSFDGSGGGIGGTVREAQAYVTRLQIGPFVVRNAPVIVVDSQVEVPPLITVEFLRHYTMTISNDTLTLAEN